MATTTVTFAIRATVTFTSRGRGGEGGRREEDRIRAQVIAGGGVNDLASLQPPQRRNAYRVDFKVLEFIPSSGPKFFIA